MNNKGLSEVVTNVLMILLAVVAIGVLWGFLSPMFTKTGQKIDATQACLGVSLEIPKCTLNASSTSSVVLVKRNGQNVTVKEIKVIIEKTTGETESFSKTTIPGPLETIAYSANVTSGTIAKASAAIGIQNVDGTITYCAESAKMACV